MVLITTSAYMVWRAVATGRRDWRRILTHLANYGGGVIWGFVIGAVQWLPAIFAVTRSAHYALRQSQHQTDVVLPVPYLSTWILPEHLR